MTPDDEKLMRQALVLARRGIGKVEPNPAVGALLVKAGQIIGRGWHREFGGPHAEIAALEDCASLGVSPRGATLYVTLEPCCHQGKTGPCTEALIRAGIQKVIVATGDPSVHARGAGLQQLQAAALNVEVGCCEREARLLNAPFLKFAATGRTWTVLKWAQTLDGHLAHRRTDVPETQWISNSRSRADAHRLRRRTQAILVGIGTVLADNPRLTPRPSRGKTPLRVVLDSRLRIPLTCRLLRSAAKTPTLVATTQAAVAEQAKRIAAIEKKGATILACPGVDGVTDLDAVLQHLSERGIQQLLVEGGPTVYQAFLQQQLADELHIYLAPRLFGSDGTATLTDALRATALDAEFTAVEAKALGTDIRWTGLARTSVARLLADRTPDVPGQTQPPT